MSVRAARPAGGPVRSTGENIRSFRVTSTLRAFVPFGKNGIVLPGIERRPARNARAFGRPKSGCVAAERELGGRRTANCCQCHWRRRQAVSGHCWRGRWRQADSDTAERAGGLCEPVIVMRSLPPWGLGGQDKQRRALCEQVHKRGL